MNGPADAPAPAPAGRWVGVLLLLGAAVLWSLAGVAVKATEERVGALTFTAVRSLGAAVGMWPLLGLGAKLTGSAKPAGRVMGWVAGAYTVMVGAFILSMALGTAAEGILLQYSAPAWAALLAWGLLGRRVSPRQVAAIGIAAAGVLVLLAGADRSGGWAATALGVLSGVGYAGVIVGLDAVDAEATARTGGPANVARVILYNNAAAAATLLPLALLLEGPPDPALTPLILLLGLVQMALPYVLFQLGLRRVGPVTAGLVTLVEPVLNPLWVFLGKGEVPPAAVYPGGALVLLAVAVTVTTPRRRKAGGGREAAGRVTPEA